MGETKRKVREKGSSHQLGNGEIISEVEWKEIEVKMHYLKLKG